jgi:mono/diheme cytochrome c family protein
MKIRIIYILLVPLFLASCDRSRSSTGWDYMPDMYYSNAYESYTPNPNFEDDMTMRLPVEGTVPREMLPFPWENNEEDRLAAGETLVNPLEPGPQNLEEGRAAYGVFCMSCHGESGDGTGYLFTSGRYPYPPASLVNEKVKVLKDGEIYHSITVGYGIMGAHGAMIESGERWKIIMHIRAKLQN